MIIYTYKLLLVDEPMLYYTYTYLSLLHRPHACLTVLHHGVRQLPMDYFR